MTQLVRHSSARSRPGAGILLLSWLCLTALLPPAARAVVSRAEHSRDCVMCHIEWGDDYDRLSALLPPPSHRVLIDGQPARNSSEEMCWSCHDAYVCDDRDSFMKNDPHLSGKALGFKAGDLPLDLDGQVYCGTCHTPHSHTMGRKYEMSPFLRGNYLGSELCLNCHTGHSGGGANHPLHQPLAGGRGAELASGFAPRDRVECLSCHNMHSAHSTRLGSAENQTPLCAACHQPQLGIAATRHATGDGQGESCAGCHDVHAEAGTNLPRGDTVCLRCHSTSPGHGTSGWGHPLGVSPAASAGLPLRQGQVGCASCHDPHRWSATGEADTGQPGSPASSFLRRPDQAEQGLCQGCHPKESAILASDHGQGSPSFTAMAGDSVWRCSSCHDAHGERVLNGVTSGSAQLLALSPATRLCLSCHGESDAGLAGATGVGAFSHPLGLGVGALRPAWLPRNETDLIGCETCHDPHQWSPVGEAWSAGIDGGDQSSFLRSDNHAGALCLDCHTDKTPLLGSLHDRRGQPGASPNACAACHSPHQAATPALLSRAVAGNPAALLAESDWPADSREHNLTNWSPGASGCLACHHDSDSGQRVPGAWFHPSWDKGPLPALVPENHRDLHIDCRSCHDPHQPWRPDDAHGRAQFLTAQSRETLCSTCHGDEALWRYNYYHDPDRRRP
ncbi:MAG: cytochrome c3 family protein [Candidatus Delongbacteria bacterium]